MLAIQRKHPSMLAMLMIGFASGLPIPLMGATLMVWLAEQNFSMTAIGCFALYKIPYSFRVLWGPLIDCCTPPFFKRLGQRRGWALIGLLGCTFAFFGMGFFTPSSPYFIPCLIIASLFKGCIYMVGLGYEMESLEKEQYAQGSAYVIMGYRTGLLIGGGGTLYLAAAYGWSTAYWVVASFLLLAVGNILWHFEPPHTQKELKVRQERRRFLKSQGWSPLGAVLYDSVWFPIREFFQRTEWIYVLMFLFTYKLGDDIVRSMLPPYFVEIGFTKSQIATVTKLFGMLSITCGTLLAAMITNRLGQLRAFFLFAILHGTSYFLYPILLVKGADVGYLSVIVGWERMTEGMVMTGLMAFMWRTCAPGYATAQYALFWSFISFKQKLLTPIGGIIVDHFGWSSLFFTVPFLFLPGLLLLQFKMQRLDRPWSPIKSK